MAEMQAVSRIEDPETLVGVMWPDMDLTL